MTQLSPHFTLEELSFSDAALRRGIDNNPNALERAHLKVLALTLLEKAREIIGAMHVNSGFRCAFVNGLVGGATDSAHLWGGAADVKPLHMDLKEAFDALARSDLPFDQLILECASWLHIGMARTGQRPRREVLMATGGPGHWHYVPYTPPPGPNARPRSEAPMVINAVDPEALRIAFPAATAAEVSRQIQASAERAGAVVQTQHMEAAPVPEPVPDKPKPGWTPNSSIFAGVSAGAFAAAVVQSLSSHGVNVTAADGALIALVATAVAAYLHKAGRI